VTVAVLASCSAVPRPAGGAAKPGVPVAAPFYVTVDNDGTASVHDAATGRLTARVPAGAAWSWAGAAATADPRVFYLAAGNATFSRLVLTGGGRLRSLTEVGAVAGEAVTDPAEVAGGNSGLTGMAVAPDGTMIAFGVLTGQSKGGPAGPAQLEILNLRSGHWAVYRGPSATAELSALSWAADGRHLGYLTEGSGNGTDGAWILTAGAGGDLLAASHRVTRAVPVNLNDGPYLDGGCGGMALSGTGTGGARDVYRLGMNVAGHKGYLDVTETDAATGGTIRTVFRDPHGVPSAVRNTKTASSVSVAALEPMRPLLTGAGTGATLLVIDGYGHIYRVDVTDGRSALITTDAAPLSVAW